MDNDHFNTIRNAWKAKGRPADPTDPYWASVLAYKAECDAVAAGLAQRTPAEPLVTLR